MSTSSNIHTAIVYEPKGANKTVALTDQRLVVTIAKKDKDGNYGPHLQQTMATSIPQLELTQEEWTRKSVQDAALEYFKSVQNSLISDRIKEGKKEVTTEQLSITSIIEYLDADSTGDKWTAERIATWFTDNISTDLGIKMIESGKSDKQMELDLAAVQKQFASRMESKAQFNDTQKAYFNKILSFASDKESTIYKKWDEKINGKKVAETIEDNLGF